MALVVRLREGPQEPERTLLFAGSPVRIGRLSSNEVSLPHGFVSEWHGVVRFDRNEIVYVDLRSTNGTMMDGQRVQESVPVRVSGPDTKLTIGPIEFRLSWTDQADASAFERPSIKTQFATGMPNHLSELLASAVQGVPASDSAAPKATGGRGEQSSAAALSEPQLIAERVRPAYEAYRRAWGDCLAAVRAEIESLPPARREIVTFFVANELPQLVREPEFARTLDQLGVDRVAVGCVDVEEWLGRLTHDPDRAGSSRVSPAIAMEHVGAIIEVFSNSFLDLQKGYDVFEKQMGLRINRDQTPLDRAQNLEEVIAYLMQPGADRSERLNDLKRAFTNFALHQVAILSAVVEGGRALLESLSPEVIASEQTLPSASRALARRGNALLSYAQRLWPVAPIVQWGRYKRRHDSTMEEDRFTKVLFGRKFEHSYLAVSGSREGK